MTRQEIYLKRACDEVGLTVDLGFDVACPDGHAIRSVARIRDIGDDNGMLIFNHAKEMWAYRECLTTLGYGYTAYDEPGEDSVFDLESYKELFRDWGWNEAGTE